MPGNRALRVVARRPRTRTAPVLEIIALRHPIAVLETTELVAPACVLWIGFCGSCCRTGGRAARKPDDHPARDGITLAGRNGWSALWG